MSQNFFYYNGELTEEGRPSSECSFFSDAAMSRLAKKGILPTGRFGRIEALPLLQERELVQLPMWMGVLSGYSPDGVQDRVVTHEEARILAEELLRHIS